MIDPNAISHEVEITPQKKIVVLKPVIDHITMTMKGEDAIGYLAQNSGVKWLAHAKEYWDAFYGFVLEHIKDKSEAVAPLSGFSSHYKIIAKLPIQDDQFVKLFTKPRSPQTAPVRIEFNPTKLAPGSMQQLAKAWGEIDYNTIPFPHLMRDARVTRLDIAIDCIGIRPVDLIVYNEKTWKTWNAVGLQQGTETAYHYVSSGIYKSPQLDPKKRADLMIYDKRQEALAKGTEPIFGDLEHTRIEFSLNTKCLLTSLKNKKYPFQNWRIRRTIVADPPFDDWLWQLILDSARYRGINAAYRLVPESMRKGTDLDGAKHAPADLVTKLKTWCHWPETQQKYHIGQLISWAEAALD